MILPQPHCEFGFTLEQVEGILGAEMPRFRKFMYGQTVGACEGLKYNHGTKTYEATSCQHLKNSLQMVYYVCDVKRFLGCSD